MRCRTVRRSIQDLEIPVGDLQLRQPTRIAQQWMDRWTAPATTTGLGLFASSGFAATASTVLYFPAGVELEEEKHD